MLGQSVSMVLPQVVGYKLTGRLGKLTTSTDLVLTITKVCVFLLFKMFSLSGSLMNAFLFYFFLYFYCIIMSFIPLCYCPLCHIYYQYDTSCANFRNLFNLIFPNFFFKFAIILLKYMLERC